MLIHTCGEPVLIKFNLSLYASPRIISSGITYGICTLNIDNINDEYIFYCKKCKKDLEKAELLAPCGYCGKLNTLDNIYEAKKAISRDILASYYCADCCTANGLTILRSFKDKFNF